MKSLRTKLITYFVAAGVAPAAAFLAYDLSLPSEGLVQTTYIAPEGNPTICVGHMDKSLKPGKKMTVDECMALFAQDWVKHEAQLNSVVKVPYKSEWQKAALTDFTFNLGIGNVKSSTLIKLLNQGKHTEACNQLTRWVYSNGQKLNGLVKRRNASLAYCLGELPWDKQQAFKAFEEEYRAISKELEKKTAP